MDVEGDQGAGSPESKASAPKDRSCPFCGQAFTSSSLGRHLDLYIKEKNPKQPDGIHDVEAIRKMRGGITRRQPRGSLQKRDPSIVGTPGSAAKNSPTPGTEPSSKPATRSAIPKEGQFVVDKSLPFPSPFPLGWEVTGVMNDISAPTRAWSEREGSQDPASRPNVQQQQQQPPLLPPPPQLLHQQQQQAAQGQQRGPSRALQRQQLDSRQKLADAVDTARAAELALRELLSSWRAAKQHIEMNSLPFDFDPLSLDFPALTLQCLQAPPTLFSSTPHPTSSSWSVEPPAQKQFEALKTYFDDEFRKWKVACASATTTTAEDLTYPPQYTQIPQDVRENINKAERNAALLEKQVSEHLHSTFQVWDQLAAQRKSELWSLELARSVGRRQKEVEKFKESQHFMKQENENLKSHVDQLNRLQQPREFKFMPPATIAFDQAVVGYTSELGVKGARGVGLNMDDRHVDLSTLVSRAIERWKAVIVQSRPSGMNAQRTLDQPVSTPAPTTTQAHSTPAPSPIQIQHYRGPQQAPSQQQGGPSKANDAGADARTPTTATTGSAQNVASTENSDEDADAEMEEDDGFAASSASASTPIARPKLPQQQQQQLEVPRTRGHGTRGANANDASGMMNASANPAPAGGAGSAMNTNRLMPNTMHAHGQRRQVHSVGGGDQMFMD